MLSYKNSDYCDVRYLFLVYKNRWGFVTHAAIDGYSRAIVFCKISNNNRSRTVLEGFLSGVATWGCPMIVRLVLLWFNLWRI